MSSRNKRVINLPAPYLRRLWLDPSRITDRAAYPYCLPFLSDDFELRFERAITIIVGENGTGKSTLLEGIAALAGYDEAGGGTVIGTSMGALPDVADPHRQPRRRPGERSPHDRGDSWR